jgi:hypothetical protein
VIAKGELGKMAQLDPGGFVRVVANILPDKLEVDVRHAVTKVEWVVVEPESTSALSSVAQALPSGARLTIEHSDINGLEDKTL